MTVEESMDNTVGTEPRFKPVIRAPRRQGQSEEVTLKGKSNWWIAYQLLDRLSPAQLKRLEKQAAVRIPEHWSKSSQRKLDAVRLASLLHYSSAASSMRHKTVKYGRYTESRFELDSLTSQRLEWTQSIWVASKAWMAILGYRMMMPALIRRDLKRVRPWRPSRTLELLEEQRLNGLRARLRREFQPLEFQGFTLSGFDLWHTQVMPRETWQRVLERRNGAGQGEYQDNLLANARPKVSKAQISAAHKRLVVEVCSWLKPEHA